MKDRYLEVTFRKGKPVAAYLYLPRPTGAKSVATREAEPGLLVDYAEGGAPIGLEITAPSRVTLEQLNRVLIGLGMTGMRPEDLAPLQAA